MPKLYVKNTSKLALVAIPVRDINSPDHAHIGDIIAISPTEPGNLKGRAPQAENDFATTPEESPVTIDILSNDKIGKRGDDDDDDDEDDDVDRIDRRTVDLNPDQSGIQSSTTSDEGLYNVTENGSVTFVPVLNFFGTSSIRYTVDNEGRETSNKATINVTVTNVNDAPVIVGQGQSTINAQSGEPLTITLNHLIFTDPDNHLPGEVSLLVLQGANYTASGNTVTPQAGFSGVLPVEVILDDGIATSQPFTLNLLVTKDNVVPIITGQSPDPITTPEDQALTITSNHLVVSDPDDKYPADFTIRAGEGSNYTVSGLTITPAANFTGTLSVPVVVNDGESNSAPYSLRISITPVNDAPVVTGQPSPISTGQGQPVTIALANITATDPDHSFPTGFSLTVLSGANYTMSGNTITPAAGFSGTLNVNVAATDPLGAMSAPFALTVSVTANAAPEITGQTDLNTSEDTPLAISLSNIFVSDPDNAYPSGFTFRLSAGTNYTVNGDVVTPASNFEGNLVVPVVVNDGTSDSQPFDLQIIVQGVNDAPVITGQVALNTSENQGIALDLTHLIVVDPDNAYPGTFTLSVLGGENYSVSGNLITPATGFNGQLTVRVFVNDGSLNSQMFDVIINVNPINDPPVITGQRALEVTEDSPIILSLQDLTVTDADNTYPEGFTMAVQPGVNYTYSGVTVVPSADFTGTLSVNVIVNDGVSNSAPFALQISVLPVNDAPLITGQQTLITDEDVSKTILLSDLIVTDPDNAYPSGFTLLIFPGANYTLSENTVIPTANYYGTLTVQAQVSDGVLSSNIFDLAMQVAPVNDAPAITGQTAVETGEDTPVTIVPSHLSVLDVDNVYPTGFTLSVSAGTNYTVSGSTITPAADYNGTLNVPVTVSDGITSSAPFAFQIQVGNANDAPVITGQFPVSTDEEKAITISLTHLTVTDPDNPYPAGFTLLVSPGTNYSVTGQTITPALNFAGVLTIPLRVNDGINNSATFNFQLTVNQINDAPVFAAIPNQQLVENAQAGSITITGISKGPSEDYQQLTFVATSSNTALIENPVITYNGTAATAVLSYVIKPNASGVATLTIVAIDNGSNVAPNQNSYSASFQVEVLEVNTAPTLNIINNITVMEDAEQQNVTLTGITAGPGETQALTVVVTSDKPDFFELLEVAYTSPEANGLLQFKFNPNIFGTVQISVTVSDNGSATSPHVNRTTRVFSVVIQPVNDPPVFTSQPVTVGVVNEGYLYRITATDPDGGQVTISAIAKPSWASLTSLGSGQATLSGTPPAGALGNAEVRLQARDATTPVEQSFTIYVNVRPSITPLSIIAEEDTQLTFPSGFFGSGYTDVNNNPMTAVQVVTLPVAGQLTLSGEAVNPGDTIQVTSLSGLAYTPKENYFGMDSLGWKAFDGYHFSLKSSPVKISILSINDPPQVIFEGDTLQYEVNGESVFLTPLVDIIDPDDDTLSSAVIGFHARNYRPETDLLEFHNTTNLRGTFDFQSGLLRFTGIAPVAEYRTALRSIRYLHQNTLDPLLEPKVVFFTLNDGETESLPKEKVIILQYTFIEFEIPSGFTPNGDHANDTWVIDRPGGGLEEMDNAIISVYNKQGVVVFRAKGFNRAWDGTMNGEPLPADTYFFTIDLQLRNKKTYKGIVTILR